MRNKAFIWVSIILCLSYDFCSLSSAKGEPVQALKLLEAIDLAKKNDIIKAELPKIKNKDFVLVGRYKVSSLKKKDKVVQIIWTSVANEKNQIAALEQPFIATLKTQEQTLPKETLIPFNGEYQEIVVAIKKLIEGKNIQDIPKSVENPKSTDRRVLVGQHESVNQNAAVIKKNMQDETTSQKDSKAQEDQSNKQNSLSSKSDSNTGRGLGNSSSGQSFPPLEINNGTSPQPREERNRDRRDPVGLRHMRGRQNEQEPRNLERPGTNNPRERNRHEPALPENNNRGQNGQGNQGEGQLVTIFESCPPRIDEVQDRVIKQQKAIVRQGDRVISNTGCRDTFDTFVIRRDYNGVGCEDRVDNGRRIAEGRYRKYWVDEAGQRQELNDRLYVEEDNPHPFIEERGQCRASVNLRTRKAHPQIETVYYGRGNRRVVVQTCHDDPNAQTVDILETPAQCTPVHNLVENFSKEQARDIFRLDGVEHEARACHEVGERLPHQFDASLPCKPVRNLTDRTAIHTGIRYITLRDGTRLDLSSRCELFGARLGLQFTTEGCDGYSHDFVANRSYPLGRWYFLEGQNKRFVTRCVAGQPPLDHQFELVGYRHDDARRISYPEYKITIRTPTGPQVIADRQVRSDRGNFAYVYNREERAASQTRPERYEGCYKITPLDRFGIYRRRDGTEYREASGNAGEQRSTDLCQRTSERKNAYEYTVDRFHLGEGGFRDTIVRILDIPNHRFARYNAFDQRIDKGYVYRRSCVQVRQKVTYPGGRQEYTPWRRESGELTYTPYCRMGWASGSTLGVAEYSQARSHYPGSEHRCENNGLRYVLPGPNRVN